MSTLTETAYYTRRAINWGIIGIVVFFTLRFLFGSALNTWRQLNPPPPPPPTVAFGKLPALELPANRTDATDLKFTLETIEGKPYLASNSAAVYFIPKPAPNLLALTRAKQFAGRLDFNNEPTTDNQSVFRFIDSANPARSLDFNIVTNNFDLSYNYGSDIGLFNEKNLPSAGQAVQEAKNFLQNFGLASPAFVAGEEKITYLALSGNNLLPTTSYSGANAIRVDLGRSNLEDLKLFPPDPQSELIYFIFSPSSDQTKKFLKISYKFWPVEIEQRATYPLKTADLAWEELKNNKGYIASPGQTNGQAVIRKMFLGYFYPENYQQFLQPIYVFEGDPNFLGFVPAILPAWVQ